MTISDISNILTVMEEKSINRAATKLYISQPSLSKCIKKVESECNCLLFERTKGSSLQLTEAGKRFQEMGISIVQSHQNFLHSLDQIRRHDKKNILFATTLNRAYDLSGPVVKWVYDRYPGYNMELKTSSTAQILEDLAAGIIDMAEISEIDADKRFSQEVVAEDEIGLYLRKGCTASREAQPESGRPYPVLSLRALAAQDGERLVENSKGTGGRRRAETVMERSNVHLPIIDRTSLSVRIAMVNAGYASMLIGLNRIRHYPEIDLNRVFCLPADATIRGQSVLMCRREFRNDPRFEILLEAIRESQKK